VTLKVTQAVIGAVTVSGNEHFSADNIRASLPPCSRAGARPARHFGLGAAGQRQPGQAGRRVAGRRHGARHHRRQGGVTDNDPLRVIATLDNTGTPASGRWRTGIAVQHANLFDRDHVGTLAYTTSPDSPSGMRLELYSLGYRIPLYGMGDSIDLVYGKSSANSPASSPTLGGVLGFTGRGDIYGVRWNHFLGRSGESSARLVLGIDRKRIDSRCDVGGEEVSIAPPTPPISACVPYQTTPLSLTYVGQRESVGERTLGYSLGCRATWRAARATPTSTGASTATRTSRPATATRATASWCCKRRGFMVQGAAQRWQVRLNGSAQYATRRWWPASSSA
jgi:hemolysin activation/secretion protein